MVAYVVSVPLWVWLAIVSALAEVAILCVALRERRRSERWEFAARAAAADARMWRNVARAASVHTNKTIVSPAFHFPRG